MSTLVLLFAMHLRNSSSVHDDGRCNAFMLRIHC